MVNDDEAGVATVIWIGECEATSSKFDDNCRFEDLPRPHAFIHLFLEGDPFRMHLVIMPTETAMG